MTRNAITDVHAPRQASRKTICSIRKTVQNASDSADSDPRYERQDEQVARGDGDAQPALDPFDRYKPAD